jgi:hypothetical protein
MSMNVSPRARRSLRAVAAIVIAACGFANSAAAADEAPQARRFLYVAVPGIRNYLEFGGHGLVVFDIDNGH